MAQNQLMINMPSVGGGVLNINMTPLGCLITWYHCVGTQQRSCWKCRSVREPKCFDPPPRYHKIFIAPVEPRQQSTHADICCACRAAVEIPPKARPHSLSSTEDVVDMALTARSNPEAQRGTGNSWLLIDWSGAWDFPTRLGMLLVEPGLWLERVSAPLHTREKREGRERSGAHSALL